MNPITACSLTTATLLVTLGLAGAQQPGIDPSLALISTDDSERTAILEGRIPAGNRHIVLQESSDLGSSWNPVISGPLTGAAATVTFRCPASETRTFFRIATGTDTTIPPATFSGPEMLSIVYDDAGSPINTLDEINHVLNRLAYGPSPEDFTRATTIGASAYIEEQLTPSLLPDDTSDPLFQESFNELLLPFTPDSGEILLPAYSDTRYFRGTTAPPSDWTSPTFDDASWLLGELPIGYPSRLATTVLSDMRSSTPDSGYISLFLRQKFNVADPASIESLALEMLYDDSFIAYLNGTEIARRNITGSPPGFNASATNSQTVLANSPRRIIDVTAFKSALITGENVLAIQGHNSGRNSNDFFLSSALFALPEDSPPVINGINQLKQILHLRGIHSKRQLQTVLAEFWENHFTTDYDKVNDYIFNSREYREARRGLSTFAERRIREQARFEAASIELREYEFLYNNALGHFGDLLLYSATSPSMLIYLDSVENTAEEPNENYAREIFELSAFGVDNRYTQEDIVELAKCFTGWTIRKARPADILPFPQSALTPFTTGSITIDTISPITDIGTPWSYIRGTSEPPADWILPNFNDSAWPTGPAGFGFEAGNDNAAAANIRTTFNDMRQTNNNPGFASVYIRNTLSLPDTSGTPDLITADITYDDGFVLYLNGNEIFRSRSMRSIAGRPTFDALTTASHEHSQGIDRVPLSTSEHYIPGGNNTIAIQAHQRSLTSNDFSILPRISRITFTSDSIDPVSTNGLWTFRFDPSQHDTTEKILFPNTEFELTIPAGRTGAEGIRDALDVIDLIVAHPSTAEFISIKLVNKFVSDGISLDTYRARTAPDSLLGLVDQCVQAWTSTPRPGHIPTILRRILDPAFKASPFWGDTSYFTKAKTPIEFTNSAVRLLNGSPLTSRIYLIPQRQGMSFFDRDDPDGYSELGVDWINTLGFLERMRYAQDLGDNNSQSFALWPESDFGINTDFATIDAIIEYFNTLGFGGRLTPERRNAIETFANTRYTDNAGTITSSPSPFSGLNTRDRRNRLRETIGLILSLPEFHLQ